MVRLLTVAAFLPLIVYTGIQLIETGDLLPALENALRSPFADWTPVAGWASAGVVSLISGHISNEFLSFGLLVLLGRCSSSILP